jgi:hypothetical protein
MSIKATPGQPSGVRTSSPYVTDQLGGGHQQIKAAGASAGTPGKFTPAGASPPLNLSAITGVVASPKTAWTTGQRVVLADLSEACWSGTSWVGGRAP